MVRQYPEAYQEKGFVNQHLLESGSATVVKAKHDEKLALVAAASQRQSVPWKDSVVSSDESQVNLGYAPNLPITSDSVS